MRNDLVSRIDAACEIQWYFSRKIHRDAEFTSAEESLKDLERVKELIGHMTEIEKRIAQLKPYKIVRCADCEHWEMRRGLCHNPRWGDGHGYYPPPATHAEGFCFDGKLREGVS